MMPEAATWRMDEAMTATMASHPRGGIVVVDSPGGSRYLGSWQITDAGVLSVNQQRIVSDEIGKGVAGAITNLAPLGLWPPHD